MLNITFYSQPPMIKKIILMIIIISVTLISNASNQKDITHQRNVYSQVLLDLNKNRNDSYLKYKNFLANYPLTPYLTYKYIINNFKNISDEQIEHFIKENSDLPRLNTLTNKWLLQLAQKNKYNLFEKYYNPKQNQELKN